MRFLPTKIHGVLDYATGLALIAAPWLFGFADDGPATWVPVLLGIGVIGYSLMTHYELGAVHKLSMPTHLGLDIASGILLALSPWLFGFADYVYAPHLAVGLFEIVTAMVTEKAPREAHHPRAERRMAAR